MLWKAVSNTFYVKIMIHSILAMLEATFIFSLLTHRILSCWCEGHLYGKPSAVARPRARSGMCNSSHSAPRIVLWMPHQAPSPLPSFFPTVHPEGRKHLSPPLFCRGPEMRRLRVGTCCSLLRRNRRGEERIHTWSLRSSIHPHKKAFRLRRIGALGARPQSLLGGERWNGARGGGLRFA